MAIRVRILPALLAALAPTVRAAAPARPAPSDRRARAFLRLHPAARAALPVARRRPAADEETSHRKYCATPHPPPAAAGPVLASMRAVVAATDEMKEDWRVFFTIFQHAEALLSGPDPIPAGLCATLRGGVDGANEASSYAAAAGAARAVYTTVLAVPHLFTKEPRSALVRGLQLHRDAARALADPDDRRRALKLSLYGYARCPDLVPSRPLAWAMLGLGSASIIPDLADSARALDAVSAAVATVGDDPRSTAYTLGIEAARAARTLEAKFWLPYVAIDRLLQTEALPADHAEALAVAKHKAFKALETWEAVELMTATLRDLAGAPARGATTPPRSPPPAS